MTAAATGAMLVALLPAPPVQAVVGGRQTPVGQFPWTVSVIHRSTGTHECTGALISPTWVLTAGHCTLAYDPVFSVRTGSWDDSSGGQVIEVVAVHANPSFNPPPTDAPFLADDVALMQLASPSSAPTIALARPDQAAAWAPGTVAAFSGFGDECGPPELVYGGVSCAGIVQTAMHDAALPVIDNATCAADYPTETVYPDLQLCTLHSGVVTPCHGDSGGPLVATTPEGPVIVGVISGGRDPCGSPNSPSVFARVTAFLDWIHAVSGVSPPPAPPPSTTTTSTSSTTYATAATRPTPAVATPTFTG